MPDQENKVGRYALALIFIGALGRLLLLVLWPHSSFAPSIDASYSVAAKDFLRLNFHAWGDRVPAYPLLIALCGLNLRALWVAQAVLGIASSLMIFDMAVRRTRHRLFSLFVGVACSLIPEVLEYEVGVATEALTGFLLVASLWLISRWGDAEEDMVRYPLALGSVVALAGLTRPLMICLVPVYFCFLVPLWPPAKMLERETLKKALFYALPVVVLIFGWCGFNFFNCGYFSPTTRAGQQLMDQVDPYVSLAPDRFGALRDAWIESRRQATGAADLINREVYLGALPEMERRTGKTEIQVNHDLASLALYLEIHHPLLCLRRVEQGWMQFWGQPDPKEVEWPEGGKVGPVEFVATAAKFLVREFKAAFLVLAFLSSLCVPLRLKVFTRLDYLIFAVAVWVSVFAAFTEFGENRRFGVPFYMLLVYTVLTQVWLWIAAASKKDSIE